MRRRELETVTSKLHMHVCRYCKKATDSLAVGAAGPAAPVTIVPRDQLPQSYDQPHLSLAESNGQQSQHQLEILARRLYCFIISLSYMSDVSV